jgi:hypothetical protein
MEVLLVFNNFLNIGCEKCKSGSQNEFNSSTTCNLCKPGMFSNIGSKYCSNCPENTYSYAYGSSNCLTCGNGMWSDEGSSKCSFINGSSTYREKDSFFDYSTVSKSLLNKDFLFKDEKYQFNFGLDKSSICGENSFFCKIIPEENLFENNNLRKKQLFVNNVNILNLAERLDHMYLLDTLILTLSTQNKNLTIINLKCMTEYTSFNPVTDLVFLNNPNYLQIDIRSSFGVKFLLYIVSTVNFRIINK